MLKFGVLLLAGLFASLEDWTLKIGLIIGFIAAVVAFHKQVVAPVMRAVLSTMRRINGMVDVVEDVPGQLEEINGRLSRGDVKFDELHLKVENVEKVLEVLGDSERKMIERRIYAEVPERRTPIDRRDPPHDPHDPVVDGASEAA